VRLKPCVGLRDRVPIEHLFGLLAQATFVAGDQQYRLPLGVEGEGHTPYTVVGIAPQFPAYSRSASR
jgi:hypothetical protein